MAPRIERETIHEKKLLLTEGEDDYYFFIWACQSLGLSDIQVMNFRGISNLRPFLKDITLLFGFDNVESIVISRDAEQDATAAKRSVESAISNVGLAVPSNPFEFSGGKPRVAFMLFPGYPVTTTEGRKELREGALEDLCIEIVKDKSILHCVDQYIQCLQPTGQGVKYLHKTKVHAYLSGIDNFVGLKIGEATRAGAWDLQHACFEPFRQIITSM